MDNETIDFDTHCKSEEFRSFVKRQFEAIDDLLSDSAQPVYSRPMLASMYLVQLCIHDKDGKPPGNYLEEEWFGQICAITTRWYRARFGTELLKFPKSSTAALVVLFGATFQISIPHFPTTPSEESGIAVLYFAKEVLGHEKPLNWVNPRPDLSGLSVTEATDVRDRLRTVCNLTRSMGLDFAVTCPGQPNNHSASIQGHIEKGVTDICAGRRGTAIWEFHLAVEKVLKGSVEKLDP